MPLKYIRKNLKPGDELYVGYGNYGSSILTRQYGFMNRVYIQK